MSSIDSKATYDSFAETAPSLLKRAHMMLLAGHSAEWIVNQLRSQMADAGKHYTEEGLLQYQIAVEYLAEHQGEIGLAQLLDK